MAVKRAPKTPSGSTSVVGTYTVVLSVPGPTDPGLLRHRLNQMWGFEDGACNQVASNGVLTDKPGSDDPRFVEAHHALTRSRQIVVVVTVYKDGAKTFELLQPREK